MIHMILFGPPGSGKGTQAKKIAEEFGIIHISTGDLFRYELGNNTELGQLARSFMDNGELVPDKVTTSMLKNRLLKVEDDALGIIYDGYPRNLNQANSLEEILEDMDEEVTLLLSLNVEDDEIVHRILERGKISGRSDDQDEATIRKRIQIYKDDTQPVFAYFDAQDKAVSIDGSGSIDEVFERIKELLAHFIEEVEEK